MDSIDKMSLIVRHCRTFSERKLKEYDLTFGEQVIIMYLASHENVNQDTISKTYQIDKSLIAKTLSKLEQKNVIIKRQNPDNKRENLISLSQSADHILDRMKETLAEWNTVLFQGMSLEEIETVYRLTAKMEENVEQYLKNDN